MNHTENQRNRIKAILDSGRKLNPLQAFYEIGTLKLASRISELIQDGYPIKKDWITVKNRFQEDVKVREYSKG